MNTEEIRCVVIADGHFNPLGLVRSLGKAGMRPDVIIVGDEGALVTKSKYPRSLAVVNTNKEAVDYAMEHFADKENKAFLMTGSDKTIAEIDSRYNELSSFFITYNCGKQGGINTVMSKALQNDLAREVGLTVPDFEEVDRGEMPAKVKFPVITKAVDSRVPNWKSVVHICHNERELQEAYSEISCERVLLQHYVAKENETGFNGISINHGRDVYLPLQLSYFSTEPDTFGNAVYLFRPTDMEMVDKVKKLIAKTGYEGAFSVDFLIGEDGKTYFLEINFRNSGWAYPYTCAGVNLAENWVRSMLSGHLETDSVRVKKLPFSSIVDLWEMSAQMKKGFGPGLKAVWQTLVSDSYIFWDIHDLGPFRHIVKCWIKSHILRR